jgi:type II protein arginine methyltransferase
VVSSLLVHKNLCRQHTITRFVPSVRCVFIVHENFVRLVPASRTMATADGTPQFPLDESTAILFVGHHEKRRTFSPDVLQSAQEAGYDILTTPITTEHFQSRVLAVLQQHVDALSQASVPDAVPTPLVSPLTPLDTDLTPNDGNASLVAVTSPWIDLGSPDPLIAGISRQVFNLEVAYAAFCGINNVLAHGPVLESDAVQFGRAIQEAIGCP